MVIIIYTFYNKDCRHCLKISIWTQDVCSFNRMVRLRIRVEKLDTDRYLDLTFPDRWIGRDGPMSWCPRSPNLSNLNFFLWGYLKNVVYLKTPTTREDITTFTRPHLRRSYNIDVIQN